MVCKASGLAALLLLAVVGLASGEATQRMTTEVRTPIGPLISIGRKLIHTTIGMGQTRCEGVVGPAAQCLTAEGRVPLLVHKHG